MHGSYRYTLLLLNERFCNSISIVRRRDCRDYIDEIRKMCIENEKIFAANIYLIAMLNE